MVLLDKHEIAFPDPAHYDPEDGLIAIGGDLSVERVWFAYQLGIFPWYNPDEEILWWCPDPRFVLSPNEVKISTSMKKIFKEGKFTFTENQCFEEVMQRGAEIPRRDQEGTRITEEMKSAYTQLHHLGKAKSIEVWQKDELVGGFYGVEVGNVFSGESMFSFVSNASKAALIWFCLTYKEQYQLIDCQVHTSHLESMGAKNISKKEFLQTLQPKTNQS